MRDDTPCTKCKHPWFSHKKGLKLIGGEVWPTGCDEVIHEGAFCLEFEMDNLKYLEKLSEE